MAERVIVIGGSGFIGTRLVYRLLEANHDVRIADKVRSTTYPDLTTQCDVRDLESLRRACRGGQVIYNLAAEHRDDVRPLSLYHEVNVLGAKNTCVVASEFEVRRIVFTSSVAVYGFGDQERSEGGPTIPFNAYGRSKLEAESAFQEWLAAKADRSLTIIRPTVVFGEGNRGNVYQLIRQIAKGPFLMIGDGTSVKSMAYVENVAAFLEYALGFGEGLHLYNYVDKPDFDMNALVREIRSVFGKSPSIRFRVPYPLAYLAGLAIDGLAALTGRSFPVSRVRIRKFCAPTRFSSERALSSSFSPPVDLKDALRNTIEHERGRGVISG